MRGATMFSGIGAPEVAMPWVEWLWCAEIEKFPSAVLAHRHPQIQNLGDVTATDFIDLAKAFGELDLLVAGSPCQAFSIAGLRRSLEDERGNLTLRLVEVVHAIEPRYLLWENVPGVLSTDDNAFGCFLGGLVGDSEAVVPGGGAAGRIRVWSMDPQEQQRGASWMPNTSAWPNDADVCSLSSVLETGLIPQKYFLSGRACAGILRRAERRKKTFPARLVAVLKAAAGATIQTAPEPSSRPPSEETIHRAT